MTLIELSTRCARISLSFTSGTWSLLCLFHTGHTWAGFDGDLEALVARVPL